MHERLGVNELTRCAIEDVQEAVGVRHHHRLARLAADGDVREHGNLIGIPIMRVVRGELEVPFQCAGVRVQRQERSRIQVVALAVPAVEVGIRVARPQ